MLRHDEPIQYRRLGYITPQQFQSALDRFDLGTFVSAESIGTGGFGQNVFVTSTAGEFVLRGRPHYPWQFPKERLVARLLHEQTEVPIPWPYLFDGTTDIFGWEYCLMPRLPGLQTADAEVRASLSSEDMFAVADAMGTMLAAMHTLMWPSPAEYSLEADDFVPVDGHYFEWVATGVRGNLNTAVSHSDRTPPDDAAWVEDVLAHGRAAVEQPFAATIVHRDFNYNNVVLERSGAAWSVSGVFDLMEAYMGDGEADLARLTGMYLDEDPALARAYLQSYLRRRLPRPGFADRFAVYMLDDRLIVWEYGQRHPELEWWDRTLTLRQWAEPYLLAISSLL